MCECGCAGTRLFHARLDLNGHDHVYTVALHPGCDDCGTGPAFMLERFTRDEARSFDIPYLPRVRFDSGGCHFIPGVEPAQLLKAMNEECEWVEDMFREMAGEGDMAKVLLAATRLTTDHFEMRARARTRRGRAQGDGLRSLARYRQAINGVLPWLKDARALWHGNALADLDAAIQEAETLR